MDNNKLLTSMMTSCSLLGRFMRFGADVLNMTDLEEAAPVISDTLSDVGVSAIMIVNHQHFKLCQKIHSGVHAGTIEELIKACRPGDKAEMGLKEKVTVTPNALLIKGEHTLFAMDLRNKDSHETGIYQDNMALFTDMVDKFINHIEQFHDIKTKADTKRMAMVDKVTRLEESIALINENMIKQSQAISMDFIQKAHLLVPKFDLDIDQEEQIVNLLEHTAKEYTDFFQTYLELFANINKAVKKIISSTTSDHPGLMEVTH